VLLVKLSLFSLVRVLLVTTALLVSARTAQVVRVVVLVREALVLLVVVALEAEVLD
jgi:hypothetical protein